MSEELGTVADKDTAATALALRDEDGAVREDYVERVAQAIAAGDSAALRELVGDLHEADAGDLIEALDPELRPRLIKLMGHDFDFSALTEVDDAVREEILEELPAETVAEGVRELDSDDAVFDPRGPAEGRADRDPGAASGVRAGRAGAQPALSGELGRPHHADRVHRRAAGVDGRAGDRPHARDPRSAGSVLGALRGRSFGRLQGAVALDRLLRTKRPVPIAAFVNEELSKVRATDDQEDVARLFERYDLVSAPVVDENDRLVGVITFDDIVDVIEEEAEEDIKALGGVGREEELSDSVWRIAKGRFPWLFANLLTALLASWVISNFENALTKMVALAVLMPVVASMGGNAGTQTMTVAVRALATRELSSINAWRVIRREFLVGVLNGLAFALIMGVIASTWFHTPDLGLVIALAMVTVLAAAALGGILIPLILIRLGVDPAVSSGPFVTTVTDVVGFFSFLGIATLWFGLR